MNTYCVYMHVNKLNEKKYVGLTSQTLNMRWKNGEGYKGSTRFYNAIKKYGWDNFHHIVIKDNLTKEEAQNLEEQLIVKHKTQDERYGYNLESGGRAPQHSAETIEKLRKVLKGRTFSEESKQRMREAFKTRKGHAWTEESKAKSSQTKLGHEVSKETRDKIRQAFSQPVLCVEIDKIFNSMKEAAEYFGLSKCTISAVLKGRLQTAAGYHWKLVDNS